jgi:Arc/MetJ-type ribon-helix-helix transcriptional regulator
MRRPIGEVKLAFRTSRRELKAMDAFVLAGDFRNRSELVRVAIERYLSEKLHEAPREPGSVEGPRVRLRSEELDTVEKFAKLVAGNDLEEALAMLVRYGLKKVEADEMVKDAERRTHEAPVRAREEDLDRTRLDLAERGVLSETAEQRQRRGG